MQKLMDAVKMVSKASYKFKYQSNALQVACACTCIFVSLRMSLCVRACVFVYVFGYVCVRLNTCYVSVNNFIHDSSNVRGHPIA